MLSKLDQDTRPDRAGGWAENGGVSDRRGVILYGHDVDAVAEALRDLDPRYQLSESVVPKSGSVPVLRRRHAAEADAVRKAAPNVAWLVVELYRPGADAECAQNAMLWLNTATIDPAMAARAVDQHDLVIWYEIINPIRVTTVGNGPIANDYSNIAFTVPDGHRMIAHAVRKDGVPPDCLQGADRVLPSHDLWALVPLRNGEVCPSCTRRHASAG